MTAPNVMAAKGPSQQNHQIELADVFRLYGQSYRHSRPLPFSHIKVMQDIENCRTAALGGHVNTCSHCGFERISYNSCRNRHCPKCQTMAKANWLENRKAELLPVGYFHNVFTIPHELNPITLCNVSFRQA
jgi:predicted Zn-ribbon and HTH transcriptional regulator